MTCRSNTPNCLFREGVASGRRGSLNAPSCTAAAKTWWRNLATARDVGALARPQSDFDPQTCNQAMFCRPPALFRPASLLALLNQNFLQTPHLTCPSLSARCHCVIVAHVDLGQTVDLISYKDRNPCPSDFH